MSKRAVVWWELPQAWLTVDAHEYNCFELDENVRIVIADQSIIELPSTSSVFGLRVFDACVQCGLFALGRDTLE